MTSSTIGAAGQGDLPAEALAQDELAALASRLAVAVERQEWIEDPDRLPATIDDAYRVQDMAAAMRQDALAGWKIGCTSEHVQSLFHVDSPIAGRVYAGDLYVSPATVRRIRPEHLVIEGEFVFRMGADLPPRGTPYSETEVIDAIASLHPGIEYVQSRIRKAAAFNAIRTVADNSGFGALIVGEGTTDWDPVTLPSCAVIVRADGEQIGQGSGREVLGSPVACMMWLVNFLNQLGHGLKAGDYVTTGACAGAQRVEVGQLVDVDFGSLGSVQVLFQQ